jgi:polysaccharide biosynthesis/export protein
MKIISLMMLLGSVLVALSGCASSDRPIGLAPGMQVTTVSAMPVPQINRTIVIGPLSSLEISVLQDPALDGTYVVDGDGTIDFPLIGNVQADGRSPGELARAIAARLDGRFVLNPEVAVRPLEISKIAGISVGGEVESPGTYPATTATTLVRAVNEAGGLADFAKTSEVLVFREVDGARYVGIYDIEGIARGNYADPELYPGDLVMVGDSPARRRFAAIFQSIPLVTSTVLLIERVL